MKSDHKHKSSQIHGQVKSTEESDFLKKYRKIAMYLVLLSLFLMGAVFGYRQIDSPDLGFHLSSARWILQNRTFPVTDIFTYTVPNNTYIDLQWLFQLIIYSQDSLFGPAGITALTTVLTLIFSVTLLYRVYCCDGRIPLAAVWMLMLFFLGNLWEIRPHLFSWIWGSLILLVLEEHSRGSRRWLPLLPVFMVLWVNCHSLYVLGPVCIGIYVLIHCAEGFWTHRRPQIDKRLITWSIVAVLACLVNPYHLKGIQFPVSQFFLIQGESGYKSALTGTAEFLSPFRFQEYIIDGRFVLFQPRLWWQLFTLLAVVGILGAGKKKQMAHWLLFAGFFYIFHQANKNFGYFVMVCFPVVITGLNQIAGRLLPQNGRTKTTTAFGLFHFIPFSASILICVLFSIAAGSNRLYEAGWQSAKAGTGYNNEALPTEACRFIKEHGLEGRILNCWNDGGYIGWITGQKVFVNSEGNTIGLQFYDEYIKSREPQGFQNALSKWNPTIALVRYDITPYWLYHLHNIAKDWRMVYANDYTAVFLHASIAPHIPALSVPVAGRDYPVFDVQVVEKVVRQVTDAGGTGFIQWLRGSGAYPLSEMQKSAFYFHTGQMDACIGTCVDGLRKAPFIVPELMLNLGHALNVRKYYTLADRCYEAYLLVDDDPVITGEIRLQQRSRRR